MHNIEIHGNGHRSQEYYEYVFEGDLSNDVTPIQGTLDVSFEKDGQNCQDVKINVQPNLR